MVCHGGHGWTVRPYSLEEIAEGAAFVDNLSVTFPDTAEDWKPYHRLTHSAGKKPSVLQDSGSRWQYERQEEDTSGSVAAVTRGI